MKSKQDHQAQIDAHWEKFNCKHKSQSLRKRPIAGGAFQMVYQCDTCGQPTSNPISRQNAIELCGGVEPPPFDDRIARRWKKEKNDGYKRICDDNNSAFWQWYEQYLQSPEWRQRRAAVLDRDKGLCQGCLQAKATEVHHLSYKHVGNELLFELVSVCESCHEVIHADKEGEQ